MPPTPTPPQPPPGINFGDLLHMAFRHKWKIAVPSALGLVAAAAYFLLSPPIYESEARLLVRYLVERSAIDSVQSEVGTSSSRQGEKIIQSEIEILTSWDLATEVVSAVGLDRILGDSRSLIPAPEADANESVAARNVLNALVARAPNEGNVIHLSFQHSDPAVATEVLEQLVKRYFDKHLEIHRSAGTFEFVSRQADQVRSRLRQTEDALMKLKTEAGIFSLQQSEEFLAASMASNREELLAAETALAEQGARLKEIERWLAESTGAETPPQSDDKTAAQPAEPVQALAPPAGVRQDYLALVSSLSELRRTEVELSAKFTPTNPAVVNHRSQIDALERKKIDLERQYPALSAGITGATGGSSGGGTPDVLTERAHLAAVRARAESLKTSFSTYAELAGQLTEIGTQIRELERRREIEETNYKYYEQSLERARIDEALDPSKIPNISVVQKPSPGQRVAGEKRNIVLALLAAGVAIGGGLAFVSDKILDRSVRRRFELESHFGLPQLLTIPHARTVRARASLPPPGGNSGSRVGTLGNGGGPRKSPDPWNTLHHLRPYADAIRSRLIHFFHLRRLAHKPKLVAVTSVERGAGTSTLASALAASFSETGEGKVLLISMDYLTATLHPFMQGRPAFSITDALESGGEMRFKAADRNLYLATATVEEGGTESLVQQRLYDLLPQFRASDFDYIVFDLPPVTEASPALNLVGFMDKTLLIVEAGRTNRDELERVLRRLRNAEADVAGILNKYTPQTPAWLPMAE